MIGQESLILVVDKPWSEGAYKWTWLHAEHEARRKMLDQAWDVLFSTLANCMCGGIK